MANPFFLNSQIEIRDVNKPFYLIFDSIASGLDTTVIPGGILYNRVVPWSNLVEWRNEDTITTSKFYQSWWDLEMSNVHNAEPQHYQTMRDSIRNRSIKNQISIPVIRYQFAYFDSISFDLGYFEIDNGIIYDTYVSSEPYHEAEVGIAALFHGDLYVNEEFTVLLDNDLVLNNTNTTLDYIEITNLSGSENFIIYPGTPEIIEFGAYGPAILELLLHFDDAAIFDIIQEVQITIRDHHDDCEDPNNQVVESDIPFKGYAEDIPTTSLANFKIFYRYLEESVDCEYQLMKPIIIVDGYDPLDVRGINHIYENFFLYDNESKDAAEELRHLGYDLVILNFPVIGTKEVDYRNEVKSFDEHGVFQGNVNQNGRDGGADYIERNAKLLVKLIQQVNDSLTNNQSEEEIVIVGPSMGGLISRYALAYMEKQHSLSVPKMDHNTRLWVSFDAPHLGANIPVANQQLLYAFGTNLNIQDAYDSYYQRISTPAGRQQLIEQLADDSPYHMPNHSAQFRQDFINSLYANGLDGSNGFPQNTRNVTLVNGSGLGTDFAAAGLKFIDFTSSNIVGIENRFLDLYPQYKTTHHHYLKIWPFTIIENKFSSINMNQSGSMDIVPGGLYNSTETILEPVIQALNNLLNLSIDINELGVQLNHTFIPVVSALAFVDDEFNWSERLDNRNLLCDEIPFDNYFMPDNNEGHNFLTVESVNWLFEELAKAESDCPVICSYKIVGPTWICPENNEIFTLDINIPSGATTNWTVSSTLSIVNQDNNSVTVSANGSNMNAQITATIENPCGANPPPIILVVTSGANTPFVFFEQHDGSCYYRAYSSTAHPEMDYEWSFDNYIFVNGFPDDFNFMSYSENHFIAGTSQMVYLKYTSPCGHSTINANFTLTEDPPGCMWRPVLDDDDEIQGSVRLFPNPARNFLTLEGLPETEYRFSIYNAIGVRKFFGTFIHATVIESENWKKGTYFIEMENLSDSTNSVLKFSIY